jgi:hypothetical protein
MIKYFKSAGFSFLEATLTIIITSIVFIIGGLFMDKPILLYTQMSQQANATSQLTVGLGMIGNDFSQYAGGISIYSNAANTLSLQFNVPNSITVIYTCNLNYGTVYRQTSTQGSQALLNNVSSCIFKNNISSDGKTMFLNIRLVINQNNVPMALSEIFSAPSV